MSAPTLGTVTPAPVLAKLVDPKRREESAADSVIVGPERAIVRADLFEQAPALPEMVIEAFEPLDVGVMPGAGGTGKTTFELWLAVHRILGRAVFGLDVLRPGPVLVVSAEDGRQRIEYRVWRICKALNLSAAEQRQVLAGLYLEDLTEQRWRLVQSDPAGNLVRTSLGDRLAELYANRELSAVIFDPMTFFGPGERFVNDGEAEVMAAGRTLAGRLQCAVKFLHHTGKAQARDGRVDQYAGRGGSAGADNARFVHVLATHEGGGTLAAPAGVSAEDIAAGRILRLHVAKLTDGKRPEVPYWLRREGFRFDWLPARADDPAARESEALRELCGLVHTASTDGVRHTSRSLEDAFEPSTALPNRKELRRLLHVALQRGHLVETPLPDGDRRGRRTHYLELGNRP